MIGPTILARCLSVPTKRGKDGQAWQYHSRSDVHSKIACWTLLMDCLLECDALLEDAKKGRLGFAINHLMVGPINKTLDLVLVRVPPNRDPKGRKTFLEVGLGYGIVLTDEEKARFGDLALVFQEAAGDVSEVAVAVEAKACMTEHVKALPRLHAEILATGYLAKRAAPHCTVVSYTLVNTADSFRSEKKTNAMRQPAAAAAVMDMLRTAIPLCRDHHGLLGYDAVGALAIECRNDGSAVVLSDGPAAPGPESAINYARMVRQICAAYRHNR